MIKAEERRTVQFLQLCAMALVFIFTWLTITAAILTETLPVSSSQLEQSEAVYND